MQPVATKKNSPSHRQKEQKEIVARCPIKGGGCGRPIAHRSGGRISFCSATGISQSIDEEGAVIVHGSCPVCRREFEIEVARLLAPAPPRVAHDLGA